MPGLTSFLPISQWIEIGGVVEAQEIKEINPAIHSKRANIFMIVERLNRFNKIWCKGTYFFSDFQMFCRVMHRGYNFKVQL